MKKIKPFWKSGINHEKGFTLVEIIVVIAIVVIISGIMVFQFASTRRGANLENIVESISLNIRKAQTMALAVRSTGNSLIPAYQNGYGVHFSLGGLNGPQDASIFSYILFTDYEGVPGPGLWDRSFLQNMNPMTSCGNPKQTIDECVEKFNLDQGYTITNLEVCSMSFGTPSCTALTPGQRLDITFLRPNLDAYFCTVAPSSFGCTGSMPTNGYAKITVTSPTGTKKSVSVWSTGQISIE